MVEDSEKFYGHRSRRRETIFFVSRLVIGLEALLFASGLKYDQVLKPSNAHSENSGVDTGLEASSSGPSVLGVKMSEERASGNHPGNADAQKKRKRGHFLCKAQIVSVIQENEWSFVSCMGCHKKMEKRETSLICSRCETPDVTGVVRFRVEHAVDDGKDSATFVVFDKEMTKLTKHETAVLALDENSSGGEDYLPSCLEELTWKEFVFQIRVTPFNFTPNHRTFTVSTITEESTMVDHIKEHSGNILPNRGGDLGSAASSSGPSVLGDKIGENADAEKNRKRVRD
ncbi:hypothetical protein DY000_02018308 [Brassica cretica]|uniref:Replication factor A C-terminal domain-containing protein n=1 Tax=Brassica cretica TaxID=69181 RepID=A0ABQ7D9M7_BRACR|nr:hypothetical protein DY000_02018308 [Brassica cretica]